MITHTAFSIQDSSVLHFIVSERSILSSGTLNLEILGR